MKKSNITAAALAAIALLGPALGSAKEAAVNRPTSYVEDVAVMKPDKTKTTVMKSAYVDRALKERMTSKFTEGDFDPKEWLADVAQGTGYVDYLQRTYLPALQDYLAKQLIIADVAKPSGWLAKDSKEVVGWILYYVERNGVTNTDIAWTSYVDSVEKNGRDVADEAALKEYFSSVLYPFAVSQSLQDVAYVD